MPNPSPSRVASRYIDARVVPFRRDREYAAYHAFLKKMRKLQRKVDTMVPLLGGEAEDLLSDAGAANVTGPYFQWGSDKFFRRFEGELGGKKDIPAGVWVEGYAQEQWNTRKHLQFTLEEQVRGLRLMREKAGELLDAIGSRDFKDSLPYYDLTKRDLHALREGAVAAVQIPNELDYLLKRMKRVNDPSMGGDIPATAEVQDLEVLYHASVDAKGLYQKGFSLEMPEASSSAGLGGSQTGKGYKKGISFTEDQYVAQEIARVFKEVALIARGEVQANALLDQIKRHSKKFQMMEWYQKNYMPNGRSYTIDKDNPTHFMVRVVNPEHLAAVKSGEVEYDPRLSQVLERVPFSEAYPGAEGAMGLYLSHLNYSGRYDPKFFGVGGPKGLVKRFKNLNPKDIGYIKATVDMTDPHISYGKGEREFRVPPEAVLSVDKFIG